MNTTQEESQAEHDKLLAYYKKLQGELETKDIELQESETQLSLVKKREEHYLHEIEILQTKKESDVTKLRSKLEQLQQEESQLEEKMNLELLKYTEEHDRLQNKLQVLSEPINSINHSDTLHFSTDESFQESLMLEDSEVLRTELQEKKVVVDDLEAKNKRLVETNNELKTELEQVKENIDYKKQDLLETYNSMNSLQEDMVFLRNELELLKCKSAKTNDENSLFAEVNDRRLRLQEALIKLKQKYNKMSEEFRNTQRKTSVLRRHYENLSNLVQNYKLEQSQDYQTLIRSYRDHISVLEYLYKDYEKFIVEKQQLCTRGLPSNVVEFIDNLVKEKSQYEEKLTGEIGMKFRVEKMMSLNLRETNLKIQHFKNTHEQLKNKISKLEDDIENLKNRKDNTDNPCDTEEQQIEALAENKNNEPKNTNETKKTILKVTNEQNTENDVSDKENSSKQVNTCKEERKVKFTTDEAESKPNEQRPLRKGGKVIQYKTVHISSLMKKK